MPRKPPKTKPPADPVKSARSRRNGRPGHTLRASEMPERMQRRFWAKVRIDDAGCWLWTAGLTTTGYGHFSVVTAAPGRPGLTTRASRVMYALTHGECPGDMLVMHTCDNRKCVNPAHLRLGTDAENVRDMWEKNRANNAWKRKLDRTHCLFGHALTEDNIYRRPDGARECRECKRQARRDYWHNGFAEKRNATRRENRKRAREEQQAARECVRA